MRINDGREEDRKALGSPSTKGGGPVEKYETKGVDYHGRNPGANSGFFEVVLRPRDKQQIKTIIGVDGVVTLYLPVNEAAVLDGPYDPDEHWQVSVRWGSVKLP
jgi:hypothetical protein